ncbi:MAG: AAA domain-containing protein [Actinomycetota bacterium]
MSKPERRSPETRRSTGIDNSSDLYTVARNGIQVGTESYGLKHLERLTDFQRGHEIDKGAGAVVQYEGFMLDREQTALDAIAAYNEDDVRATKALRDWLILQRSNDLEWRDAYIAPPPGPPALDERVPLLHAYPAGSPEYFLGDLLGYWWREYFAYHAPLKAKLQSEPNELLDDPECVAMMQRVGVLPRIGAHGRPITPTMRFNFPRQVIDRVPNAGGKVALPLPDDKWRSAEVRELDREAGFIDLVWNAKLQELDISPPSAVLYEWIDGTTKALALQSFTDDVLSGAAPHPVTAALLRRESPHFHGSGPTREDFTADLDDMCEWVRRLNDSYVAIQGPPGAGKTYTAAHMIHALVVAGFRVGITATSHHAIGNLLESAIEVFVERSDVDRLRAVRKPKTGTAPMAHVRYVTDNAVCASGNFNLIAGTTWLFASAGFRTAPVDVLFIDEAGQMSLADALATSTSAQNVVVLGDPQQLPQVAQAFHPNGSGVSVLNHVIGDRDTLEAERGVFLPETWRMHPAITGFISQQFYEGRLRSHDSCSLQTTEEGTGLRWVRAEHSGRRTSSLEEAELVAERIAMLMGTMWTNQKGETSALGPDDFMVVAPYNDQVRTIRERLHVDIRLRDVAVGTVDKFQGREAAVVLFSMATSTAQDMTRSADFLFSRNRLNVAISRARCLAYLVCTEELLGARALNVEDMRLIASLNSFVEYANESVSNVGGNVGDK